MIFDLTNDIIKAVDQMKFLHFEPSHITLITSILFRHLEWFNQRVYCLLKELLFNLNLTQVKEILICFLTTTFNWTNDSLSFLDYLGMIGTACQYVDNQIRYFIIRYLFNEFWISIHARWIVSQLILL